MRVPPRRRTSWAARRSPSASSGDFDQTVRFLKNLEHMDRAYLVTSVSLTGQEGTYTTTVLGSMFVIQPVPEP